MSGRVIGVWVLNDFLIRLISVALVKVCKVPCGLLGLLLLEWYMKVLGKYTLYKTDPVDHIEFYKP